MSRVRLFSFDNLARISHIFSMTNTTQLIFLTADQTRQAREWLAECVWMDLEAQDFAVLPDRTIQWGIAKHFEGGIEEFIISTHAVTIN